MYKKIVDNYPHALESVLSCYKTPNEKAVSTCPSTMQFVPY